MCASQNSPRTPNVAPQPRTGRLRNWLRNLSAKPIDEEPSDKEPPLPDSVNQLLGQVTKDTKATIRLGCLVVGTVFGSALSVSLILIAAAVPINHLHVSFTITTTDIGTGGLGVSVAAAVLWIFRLVKRRKVNSAESKPDATNSGERSSRP